MSVTLRNAALLCLLAACGGDPVGPVVGSLQLSISGLPPGTPAAVHVTGPGGYARDAAASATLSGLTPGGYVVAAALVLTGSLLVGPAAHAAPVETSQALPGIYTPQHAGHDHGKKPAKPKKPKPKKPGKKKSAKK